MKTADLIKQAEELLGKSSQIIPGTIVSGDDLKFAVFTRNHMPELIDRLKRYEEALLWVQSRCYRGFAAVPYDVLQVVSKALGEE